MIIDHTGFGVFNDDLIRKIDGSAVGYNVIKNTLVAFTVIISVPNSI